MIKDPDSDSDIVRHVPVPASARHPASGPPHLVIKSGSRRAVHFLTLKHRRNDHATKETLIDPRAAEIRLGVKGLTSHLE
jgi:hypothetical protein